MFNKQMIVAVTVFTRSRVVISEYLDSHSRDVVDDLEAVCTQEQIDQLETRWFPEPTDLDRKDALDAADIALERAGVTTGDPVRVQIRRELEAVPMPEPIPAVPAEGEELMKP